MAENMGVSADDCISDDSSFYGNEETSVALETRAASYQPSLYWAKHASLTSTMAYEERAKVLVSSESTEASVNETSNVTGAPSATSALNPNTEDVPAELSHPHEGDPRWYQPTETVSEFLKRCPPLTTICEETGIDWFWIGNPQASSYNKREPDIASFTQAGYRLLETYRQKRADLEKTNPNLAKGAITRKFHPERENLRQEIADLAREKNVVCGKWMLFPFEDDLPRVWKQVCTGVLENRLGHTAKVSTTWANKSEPTRLICVYTKDCFDTEDVRRVLLALVDMGLTSENATRGIWYKMDAYTYLDLSSGNEFNLPASLYGSKDMLKEGSSSLKRKGEDMQKQTTEKKIKGESEKKKTQGKQRSIRDMLG